MSMFETFTAPKWQHKSPDVRREAIEQLDAQDVLLELINTDPDAGVQAAALARITDPVALDTLLDSLSGDLQQQARTQRLRQLLPEEDGLAAIRDDALLVRIASLTDDATLADRAIECVTSEDLRMDIACHHPVARVRLNAALGIKNLERLNELMVLARGHDKAVYRHCQAILEEHEAAQRSAREQQEKIFQLVERAAKLADSISSLDAASNHKMLSYQWQTVAAAASPQESEQFHNDMARCENQLAQLAKESAQALAARNEAIARASAARVTQQAIFDELEQMGQSVVAPGDSASIQAFEARLNDIEARWQGEQATVKASSEHAGVFVFRLELLRSMVGTAKKLITKKTAIDKSIAEAQSIDTADYTALQRQLERSSKLLGSLHWPEAFNPAPEAITQLHEVVARLQAQLETLAKDQEKYAGKIQALLETVRTKLEQDRTHEADKALAKTRKVLKSITPKQRQAIERKLGPLAAQMHEVHEWQEFAIEPKKVELCAKMKALIGSSGDVEMLALNIQSLQDEWKQIGALPNAREQTLWREFKAAADQAWKPCKEAFELQARIQKENGQQRKLVIAQLREYDEKMAWPPSSEEPASLGAAETTAHPDWRMVQKTLDTAREAFQRFKPVTPKDERSTQKAFRAICDRIYGHIKDEYARNITRKEDLVKRARELATVDDLPQAIDTCKKLQQAWKPIGLTPVGVDRKLWLAFREACDAVFARMDEQRTQSKNEFTTLVKEAEALRNQARAHLATKDHELRLKLPQALAELKQQLLAISLPSGVQQRLSKEFAEMEKQARESVVRAREHRQQAVWIALLDQIRACAAQSTASSTTMAPADPANDAVPGALLEQAQELPKGINTSLLEAFSQQGPADGIEEKLREACIALEVLAGIESPPEDKKARMNYQMQRLVKGMGSKVVQAEPDLLNSINDFIALRPSGNWAERFCSTVRKIKGINTA